MAKGVPFRSADPHASARQTAAAGYRPILVAPETDRALMAHA